MSEIFANVCMSVVALASVVLVVSMVRDTYYQWKYEGVIDSLHIASINVGGVGNMKTEQVSEMLSLLAKRKYINWEQYAVDGTFGHD